MLLPKKWNEQIVTSGYIWRLDVTVPKYVGHQNVIHVTSVGWQVKNWNIFLQCGKHIGLNSLVLAENFSLQQAFIFHLNILV